MAVSVILRTNRKPNKKGQYPLALQIVRDRKVSVSHIGHMIRSDEWDGSKVTKNHPNSVRLNNFISKKLVEATDKSLEHTDISAKDLKKKIKPTAADTFFGQAKLYLDTLEKAGKFNRTSADKPRLKHFKEFAGDIAFSEITPSLLERFKAHLKATRNINERTAVNHLVVIRSVFSQAMKDKVVDKKYYPFGKEGVKIKYPETKKIGLSRQEVNQLEAIELPPLENDARNKWLVSYYFAGMRISDVMRLQWSDFHDGRLWYTMGKNNKSDSLKIPAKANKILDQYRCNKTAHNLVFNDLNGLKSLNNENEVKKRIKTRVHETNDRLKIIANKIGISKPLTNHISRHTFGQNAKGIAIPILQKLYRHASILTTIAYQSNFDNEDTDSALEVVLDC